MRRTFLKQALAALPVLALPRAFANEPPFPSRPLRIIVPYAPGGLADLTARLVADAMAPKLGQSVVVENRPGANGSIGAAAVARAAPDGYTLGLVVSSHVFGRALVPNLPFDPVKDFAPVTMTVRTPIVLVASATIPVQSLPELLAYVRARPNALAYASAGNGSNVHVFAKWFTDLAGLQMTHVPYKGSTAAHMDLIAGRVAFAFDSLAAVQPHVAAGKLRLLAVGSPRRLAQLPELPTVAEAGLAGFEAESWGAVLAPARTPKPVVDVLHREITAALNLPAVRQKLNDAGAVVVANSPAEVTELMAADERRYTALIKRLGISLD